MTIVDQCSRVFFDRLQPTDLQPEVLDLFTNAISKVVSSRHPEERGLTEKRQITRQAAMFNHFWENTNRVSYHPHAPQAWVDALLSINVEGALLHELFIIKDELDAMISIMSKQAVVARSFIKHVQKLARPARSSIDKRLNEDDEGIVVLADHLDYAEGSEYFMDSAQEILEGQEGRVSELRRLQDVADKTARSLKELLGLKQQYVVSSLKIYSD